MAEWKAHLKWVEKRNDPDLDRKEHHPRYKDCAHCTLKPTARDARDRRSICEDCPWEGLPTGPSERFLFVWELARMEERPGLSWQECRDLYEMKRELGGGIFG